MNSSKYVIRASIATLAKLGLIDLRMPFPMETIYLLQYSENGCLAKCKFCPQSITNIVDKKFLSRVTWHTISLDKLINSILANRSWIKRICIQSIMKKGFIEEIINVIKYFRFNDIEIPISVATTPISIKYLHILKELGVDHLGIGLDAMSPKVFKEMNKPYTWNIYMDFIKKAIYVFGRKHVTIHLIIGLGETPSETVNLIHRLIRLGANIALFSYTPVKGLMLRLKRPDISYYRAIQILIHYLNEGYSPPDIVYIDNGRLFVKKRIIETILENINEYLKIFLTLGCPYCNRPYYNENPKGPFYNYYSIDHVKNHIPDLKYELLKIKGEQ
ncbi:MAG: radical SAM protein [Thermoprotei archaeon]|nr:MAG: radical SAM protein [Thermoprotei archaeon]